MWATWDYPTPVPVISSGWFSVLPVLRDVHIETQAAVSLYPTTTSLITAYYSCNLLCLDLELVHMEHPHAVDLHQPGGSSVGELALSTAAMYRGIETLYVHRQPDRP